VQKALLGGSPAAGTVVEVGSVLDRLLSAGKLTGDTDKQPLGNEEISRRPWLYAEWTVSARLALQQQQLPPQSRSHLHCKTASEQK